MIPSPGFRVPLPLTLGIFLLSLASRAHAMDNQALARQILQDTGFTGGLIVHLGCGDGQLTATLQTAPLYLVQGLDTDRDKVLQAREHLEQLGIEGTVTVAYLDGGRLPYVDNLVNLVVAEAMGEIAVDEVLRVLAPGGVLYARRDGRWHKTVKPHPGNTDQWTHYLHDPGGNAVAHDQVVGPPRHVQWIAGPRHTRSHEHTPTVNSVVSTGGRIFYLVDESSIDSIREPAQWFLIARDAYNGQQLWKRPLEAWFPAIINWGQTPPSLQEKLVAVDDQVYVTLGLHSPVQAVDAATGETIRTYANTAGTEEILCHQGTLLLTVRGVTSERSRELAEWAELQIRDGSPLYDRDVAEPLVKRLRSTESQGPLTLSALDAETGRPLWQKNSDNAPGLRPRSVYAEGDRVFYRQASGLVCAALQTGDVLWSKSTLPMKLVYDGRIACVGNQTATLLSAETGEELWSQKTLLTEIRDTFIAGGSVWLGGFKPFPEKRGAAWGPYFATQRDLDTGKVLQHIEPENPGHHHRCFQNKATDRFILGGRRGVEFIDLETGDLLWHSWVRGVCKYGVMPSNGLLYVPPHACGCYITAKLTGFYTLAAERASEKSTDVTEEVSKSGQLEQGPAYTAAVSPPSTRHASSPAWPTYRCDAERSGCTQAVVPTELRRLWQAPVGGPLSSVTVADGKLFVASIDRHRIVALDAESGDPAWQFATGARIDSPPTVHQGRAVFGSHDGSVYSVATSDGQLAWRLQAPGGDQFLPVLGQLESVKTAIGSVLLRDGVVYFTAGRSSYLDGGIDMYRVDATNGQTLSRTPIYSPDPDTGRQPDQYGPNSMPGSLADILSSDGEHVYLRDSVYSPAGSSQDAGNPHLFTLTGFLDDTWAHRSYWIFGERCSLSTGCSGRDRNLIYGRLLVFDDATIYGYGRKQVHWSSMLLDGAYRMFSVRRGETEPGWEKPVPIQVRAMLKAGDVLFAAGPAVAGGRQPVAHNDTSQLLAISTTDGRVLAQYSLDGLPVFDGMAASDGRLFIPLENGKIVCFGK